jgi:signal transduction histidine kinase
MKTRTARWIAWSVWGLVLALVAGGLLLTYLNRSTVEPNIWSLYAVFTLSALSFASVGGLIARRHPENPISWLFCAMALAIAALPFATEYAIRGLYLSPGSLPAAAWVGYSTNWLFIVASGPVGLVFLLFPDGRALTRRWGAVAWVLGVSLVLFVAGELVAPGVATGVGGNRFETHGGKVPNPIGIPALKVLFQPPFNLLPVIILACSVAAVAALIIRLRRAQGMERQQVRWLAYSGAAALLLPLFVVLLVPAAFAMHSDALGNFLGSLFWFGITVILALGIPIASGIAILKYRLYDLDVVVKKTVVFGILAAFITLVYLGVVTGIGALVGSTGDSALTFAAAAIVAVTFQPLRARARRLADRIVYGTRATPYEVLSEFSDRMAGTYSTEDVLPRLAQILGEGTGATRAEVWLRVGSELHRAAAWPSTAGNGQLERLAIIGDELPDFPITAEALAVRHQGEFLGALTVTKPPSEPLTPTETKLLSDLASQVGLVLRNVRLTSELQARLEELGASRQRLVAAQDEERRRLERNLHDGAQQQLVALGVQLGLAQKMASVDAPQVAGLLDRLGAQVTDALDDLRDLARGIYPPLLADQGLAAAIGAQARKSALPVEVKANDVGRYPQEVEAAVYFCTLEALNNVAKYAVASQARIALIQRDGELTFEIVDDGRGFDPAVTGYGTGLQGMADRLDSIGGKLDVRSRPGEGTVVRGTVRLT